MAECRIRRSKLPRKLCGTTTCSNCPWLRSSPPGEFPRERYISLASSVQQGYGPMFACHKSGEGQEFACVGYILRGGLANLNTRILVGRLRIDPTMLRATGPLYRNYTEMALANGVRPEELPPLPDQDDFVIDQEERDG